jgi:hypothetical protein
MTLQKRLERMRKRVQSDSPRSKATKLMKEAKLTREQSQKVRKHLILGSAVIVLIFQYSAILRKHVAFLSADLS